jgi:hypothetical protein
VTSPTPSPHQGPAGRGWLLIWAAMLAAGIVVRAVLGASGALALVGPGLVDVALFVRFGLPALRAVHDLSAALTIGALVLAAWLVGAGAGRFIEGPDGYAAAARTRWLRLSGGLGMRHCCGFDLDCFGCVRVAGGAERRRGGGIFWTPNRLGPGARPQFDDQQLGDSSRPPGSGSAVRAARDAFLIASNLTVLVIHVSLPGPFGQA